LPDIKLNHSWPAYSLPSIHNTSPTAPKTLDADLRASLEPLLEPFTSEFQHAAVLAFLYLHASLATPATHDVTFLLRSAIPIGSGLGSSASISVCLATALLYMVDYIPSPGSGTSAEALTRINEWAYLGERCIHGNPSGVDNTVATFGGGVVFRKERPERRMTNGQFRPHKPAEKVIIKCASRTA
jgi:mevalonate kinase